MNDLIGKLFPLRKKILIVLEASGGLLDDWPGMAIGQDALAGDDADRFSESSIIWQIFWESASAV